MISRSRVNQLLFLSIIILAVVAGWAVSELFRDNASEVSNDIDLKFTAVDHFGVDVSERTYSGYSKVFFFGFTHCPDICPISANLMSNAIDQLNRENHSIKNIKFFFVTVDPARDNPDRLKEFLSNFSNNLIGLTGTHENLMPIWKDFFVHVEPSTNSEHQNYLGISEQSDEISNKEKNYMVQHTAFYYIFDDNDVLISILPFGSSIEQMVEDLKNL